MNIAELVQVLDGNGLAETEVLATLVELTEFAQAKERVLKRFSPFEETEDIIPLLMNIDNASLQQKVVAATLNSFSQREKQCWMMHVVENKSLARIADELGLKKSTVWGYICRVKKKIKDLKIDELS